MLFSFATVHVGFGDTLAAGAASAVREVPPLMVRPVEWQQLHQLLTRGCTVDTRAKHATALEHWQQFLSTRGLDGDPFLLSVSTDRDRAALWLLHASDMHSGSRRLSGEQVRRELSLLKSNWISNLCDVGFFDLLTPDVRARVQRAQAPTREHAARVVAERQDRVKWPVTPEFFHHFINQIWDPVLAAGVGSSFTAPILDSLGACLGAMLAYNFGTRVGNLVRGSAKTVDKALRTGDLTFVVGGGAPAHSACRAVRSGI